MPEWIEVNSPQPSPSPPHVHTHSVLPAPETTPILLYEVSCVYNTDVSNLNNEMEHILRCDFSEEGSCNHTQDMAIECSE